MEVVGGENLTMLDVVQSLAPDGSTMLDYAEVLTQAVPILQHMTMVEGNLPTGNRTSVELSEPKVYTRRFNQATPDSKGTDTPMDEDTVLYNVFSRTDRDLARLGGNPEAKLMRAAKRIIRAMGHQASADMFQADQMSDDTKYNGFAARYNDPSSSIYGENMIDGGAGVGVTTCTSMYLVGWGGDTCSGMYPLGSVAGLEHIQHGMRPVQKDGGTLTMFVEEFLWHLGLTIPDWRSVARIHSLDAASLSNDYKVEDILGMCIEATDRMPEQYGESMSPHWYVSRSMSTWIQRQALDKRNNVVTIETVNGKRVTQLQGYPVHLTDSLGYEEASLNT